MIKNLGIKDIEKLIPHRPPFLFVDKITEIVLHQSAVAIKNVTMNEPFFVGHFPQEPVMPGVIIIEALAQAACAMAAASLGDGVHGLGAGKVVYFLSIEQAKFRQKVSPGDTLLMKVKKVHGRGGMWKMSGEAFVDEKLCAEATFTAMVADAPQ
ncbi:MAG: 3-hydroxyacyl-ACP dehydratase FabZ [Alphaproteobacteria bacterium]|nr:3-hydroxyacyl-ACP dehydratase FabZ [Alphaproteobacteria bacterium]